MLLERQLPLDLTIAVKNHTNLLNTEGTVLLSLKPYNKLSYKAMINSPKISEWNKSEQDITLIKQFLVIILGDIVSFFNVNKNLSANQGIILLDTIIANYRNMTLAEFIEFRDSIFAGHICGNDYKPVFDRLDGGLIIEWLRFYLENTGLQKIKARQEVEDTIRRNTNKKHYENNKELIDKEAAANREYILALPNRDLERQKSLAFEYQKRISLLTSQMQVD